MLGKRWAILLTLYSQIYYLNGLSIGAIQKKFNFVNFLLETIKNTINYSISYAVTDANQLDYCLYQRRHFREPLSWYRYCLRIVPEILNPLAAQIIFQTPEMAEVKQFFLLAEFVRTNKHEYCWKMFPAYSDTILCAYDYYIDIMDVAVAFCFYLKFGSHSVDVSCINYGPSFIRRKMEFSHHPSYNFPKNLSPFLQFGRSIFINLENERINLLPLEITKFEKLIKEIWRKPWRIKQNEQVTCNNSS